MKSLSRSKLLFFAIGQFGWSLLAGLISSWLVFFYQPDLTSTSAVDQLFIPQGLVVLGIFTIIGGITALGRLFDAVTDPWIASLSDRCSSSSGRRVPFLKWSAFPLAATTFLVFYSPINDLSWINGVWLLITVLAFYISLTAYCTPYNALIAELGHTQKERLNISTAISFTFFLGTAIGYQAPAIWGIFENSMSRVAAIRLTVLIFCVIAFIAMLVPPLTINEKEYVQNMPSSDNAFQSLFKTFKNKNFRVFVASDIFYWIALTMFQTGLIFFVTSLLKLESAMAGLYFIIMSVLSVLFYLPVNIITKKVGKKKLMLFAFFIFSLAYLFTYFFGSSLSLSPVVQGYVLVFIAALPMAIFGILPNAMVADIAESDAITSNQNREGMFFAARTFAFKVGQSIAMLIFTALATFGVVGYRYVALCAFVFCVLGGLILLRYNENEINNIIENKKTNFE